MGAFLERTVCNAALYDGAIPPFAALQMPEDIHPERFIHPFQDRCF
jgi:hypothetical protein